jgi:hypothetical protein
LFVIKKEKERRKDKCELLPIGASAAPANSLLKAQFQSYTASGSATKIITSLEELLKNLIFYNSMNLPCRRWIRRIC